MLCAFYKVSTLCILIWMTYDSLVMKNVDRSGVLTGDNVDNIGSVEYLKKGWLKLGVFAWNVNIKSNGEYLKNCKVW